MMKTKLLILMIALMMAKLSAETDSWAYVSGAVGDADSIGLQYVNVLCMDGERRITGCQTDEWGEYRMRVPAGKFHFKCMLIGYAKVDSLQVSVAAGDTLILEPVFLKWDKNVTIQPSDTSNQDDIVEPSVSISPVMLNSNQPTGRLAVKVRDEQGKPLPGVLVRCFIKNKEIKQNKTKSLGSFRFNKMPVGKYIVRFYLEGYHRVRMINVKVKRGETLMLSVVMKKKNG